MHDSETPSCLVVAHNYHPAVGAAATRLQLLVKELVTNGMQVTVLTSSTDHALEGPCGERIVGTSRDWMPKSRLARTAFLALRAALEARHHDSILSDPPPFVALASALGARLSGHRSTFYYCDSWASVASSRGSGVWRTAGRFFGVLEAATSRVADLTVASTPALAATARRHGTSVDLVRNGADLSVYTPDGPTWEGDLPENYLVYAGTMGLVHGADVFVEAARRMWADGEQAHLVFVGAGAEAEVIREAAADSAGRIIFMDPVTPEDVAKLYRGCSGALSSMRPVPGYEDAWPIKTLAAMACGAIPVYASSGQLAEDLRNAGLGFVAAYDVEEARRVMTAAITLPKADRSELAGRCHQYAMEHFDQRVAARHVADQIRAMLAPTGVPSARRLP